MRLALLLLLCAPYVHATAPLEATVALTEFNQGGFPVNPTTLETGPPFTPCQLKEISHGTAKPLAYFETILGRPGIRLNSGTWNSGHDVIDIYAWVDSHAYIVTLKFNKGMMAQANTDYSAEGCS